MAQMACAQDSPSTKDQLKPTTLPQQQGGYPSSSVSNQPADCKQLVSARRAQAESSAKKPCSSDKGMATDDDVSTTMQEDGHSEQDSDEDLRGASPYDGGESLSLRLENAGRERLVTCLANLLKHLVALGHRAHRATLFHSPTAPGISIEDYLGRLSKYFQCSDTCLILSLLYIDRLVKSHPDFVVCIFNIHRVLAVSLLLAVKFHDDTFYANSYYAKIAGLRLREMNRLEEALLSLLQWRLTVTTQEFNHYVNIVLPNEEQPQEQ